MVVIQLVICMIQMIDLGVSNHTLFMLSRIAILDPVSVKVENKMVPLRDLAQVSIKDAKTLMVNVNDVEVIQLIDTFLWIAGMLVLRRRKCMYSYRCHSFFLDPLAYRCY